MKKRISVLTTLLAAASITLAQNTIETSPGKSKIPDTVDLEKLEIPAAYKRTKTTDTQGRAIEGEWLMIDRKAQNVKFRRTADGKVFDIAFKNLCEPDRRYAELETGEMWPTNLPKFDPAEPRLDQNGRTNPKCAFDLATKSLMKKFSPEELFDHLRVRTITTAYIYDHDNYWKGNYWKNTRNAEYYQRLYRKPLPEVMQMLAIAEPANESVSLKDRIEKSGVRLFAEAAPNKPADRAKDTRPYGPPIDGKSQAYYYVSQYMQATAGKPKVDYATFISHTRPLGYGATADSDMYYSYDIDIDVAVSKAFGFKTWAPYSIIAPQQNYFGDPISNLQYHKIARHYMRNGRPVVTCLKRIDDNGKGSEEGVVILTGFTRAAGKETTYEAIVLKGPTYTGSQLKPPFKMEGDSKLPESKLNWEGAFFIE